MLKASTTLLLLLAQMKLLMQEPSFRYSLIVQTSDRGEDCPYAIQAQRQYLEDPVATTEILLQMQQLIDQARILLMQVHSEQDLNE